MGDSGDGYVVDGEDVLVKIAASAVNAEREYVTERTMMPEGRGVDPRERQWASNPKTGQILVRSNWGWYDQKTGKLVREVPSGQ